MDGADMLGLGAAPPEGGGDGDDVEAKALLKAVKAGDSKMLKSIIKGMVMDCMNEPDEDDMAMGSGPSDMEY